jgi:hypothetical protein
LNHSEVVSSLENIIKTKYGPVTIPFDNGMKKEAEIAIKYKLCNPHSYVAHTPDIIMKTGDRPEDRIFIEYINSDGGQFLFDLRGMVALSRLMKARAFVIAIRDSVYLKYTISLPVKSYVVVMSLSSLLSNLDKGSFVDLCDEDIRKNYQKKVEN